MRYRTVIFDFDGTLADSLEETRTVFNQLAEDYNLTPIAADTMHSLRHLSMMQLIDHLQIPKRKLPAILSRGTTMMRANISRLPLTEGMATVLPELRKHVHMFGILTSNSSANVDLFLRAHGIRGLFNFISSTSKLTGKAKHIRAIRKTFSLQPEEMLYVGDEIRDIKAARKAGIDIAAVTWGFNSPESLSKSCPQYLISHPDEFLQLIHQ